MLAVLAVAMILGVQTFAQDAPDAALPQETVSGQQAATGTGAELVFVFTSVVGFALTLVAVEEMIDRVWDLNGTASQIRVAVMGILSSTGFAYGGIFLFSVPEAYGTLAWYFAGPIVGAVISVMAMFGFDNPTIGPLLKGVMEMIGLRPQWGELGKGSKGKAEVEAKVEGGKQKVKF